MLQFNNNICANIEQWKLPNGITLGQRETDSNNRMIILSQFALTYIRYERVIWDLSIWMNFIQLTN